MIRSAAGMPWPLDETWGVHTPDTLGPPRQSRGGPRSSVVPVGGEDVEAAGGCRAAAAAEDQALAVAGEHGEGREAVGPRHALEVRAVDVDQVEGERAAGGIVQVGGEDD